MTDESISGRMERLVAEEHELRDREQAEREDDEALAVDRARLSEVAVELDRCWDLLRQRRAGADASSRAAKPPNHEGRSVQPLTGDP